jgi:hypothetical protein
MKRPLFRTELRRTKSERLKKAAGFSIGEVMVYMSLLAGLGYALSQYLDNIDKTAKAAETEQIISLYTMNMLRIMSHADSCTRTFNPTATFLPAAANPGIPGSPGVPPVPGIPGVMQAGSPKAADAFVSGKVVLPRIVNAAVPGVCGALPCNIVAGTTTIAVGSSTNATKHLRVKEIYATDLGVVREAGCDHSRGLERCSTTKFTIVFEKQSTLSSIKEIKRSFVLNVRLAPATLNTVYCFSTIDKDYADQDLFVNKSGDTMTGPLTIDLNPNPTPGTTEERAVYATNGYIQTNLFYLDSDRRLKSKIQDIEKPFSVLDGIRGREFTWRKYNQKDFGYIAQEVEKTAPRLVTTDSETHLKSMRYISLIPITNEAIRQLQLENAELRAELARENILLDELERQISLEPKRGSD